MKKIAFVIRLSANQASYLTQSYKSRNNSHLIHLYRKNKTSHFRPRYFLETYYDTSISSFFHIFFLSKYIQSIFCLTWNSFFFYFLLYLCLFPFVLLRLWRSTQNQTIKQTNPKERWGSKSPCNHLLAPSLACLIHLCQAIHGVRQPQKPQPHLHWGVVQSKSGAPMELCQIGNTRKGSW